MRAWFPPMPSQDGAPSVVVISAKNNGGRPHRQKRVSGYNTIISKASIICPGYLIDSCSSKKRRPGAETKSKARSGAPNVKKLLLFFLLLAHGLRAQERQTDPTWLHRYVPDLSETKAGLTSPTCHYRAIFGEGDKENRSPPKRNSLRRSLLGSAWQLPDRTLRPPGRDLFRRRRGGHAALPRSGSSVAQA